MAKNDFLQKYVADFIFNEKKIEKILAVSWTSCFCQSKYFPLVSSSSSQQAEHIAEIPSVKGIQDYLLIYIPFSIS